MDSGTYPIMIVLAAACSLVVGMGLNALRNYKDVRINPANKQKVVRDWGHEKVDSVAKTVATGPFAKPHQPLGLGVDYDEWKKNKEKKSIVDKIPNSR